MEQTLGKRIMCNRKRLGLTQDQLAERLGVTAQAVSKWENDQSCPDISMLPKLAELFGITTDILLGCQAQETACDAEVIIEDGEPDGLHISNDNWEFTMNAGSNGALRFAVLILGVGILFLVSKLLNWNISFWDILWPSALLVFGLFSAFRKFSFFHIGCILFGGYFLLQNLNLLPFTLGSELVFPIVLILFGLSLLADALRKSKQPKFQFAYNGPKGKHSTTFDLDEDSFNCGVSFGEASHRIDLPLLSSGNAGVSFGELTVDLSGVQAVGEECSLELGCSFGELTLLVPGRFIVKPTGGSFFASVNTSGHPDSLPTGIIYVNAGVSFGEINIEYL